MSLVLTRRPGPSYYQSTAVAIGNFDGLHRGHQALINKADSVLTFEPYPKAYFYPEKNIPRLTSFREKFGLLKNMGIKIIYSLPFDQKLAVLSPQEFIKNILINQLKIKKIIVGEDFRFGHQRAGDAELLQKYIPTEIIKPVLYLSEKISSTRVREALQNSNLDLARELLGRNYAMVGRVVKGDGRGRQLGFHTANIALHTRLAPLSGVYAVKINQNLYGVANIGTRPTVDGLKKYLETHIFNFDQDIYGQYIQIEFLQKIRNEQKFESIDQLKTQIKLDIETAKKVIPDKVIETNSEK